MIFKRSLRDAVMEGKKVGAPGATRTLTFFQTPGPQPGLSTNSSTGALFLL